MFVLLVDGFVLYLLTPPERWLLQGGKIPK